MMPSVSVLKRAGRDDRPRDLLDEQGDALRLGDDLFDDRIGQRYPGGCLVDQFVGLPSTKLVEREQRGMA